MNQFEKYLDGGKITVAVRWPFGDGEYYSQGRAQACVNYVWDQERSIFGYRPTASGAGDTHILRIDEIAEVGDTVQLFFEDGMLEIEPAISPDELEQIEQWESWPLFPNVQPGLEQRVRQAKVARGPQAPTQTAFEALVEYWPDFDYNWRVVGAWAADEKTLAWWALPNVNAVENDERLSESTAKPLAMLERLNEEANGVSVDRVGPQTVQASDAMNAAQKAALAAAEESLQITGIEAVTI